MKEAYPVIWLAACLPGHLLFSIQQWVHTFCIHKDMMLSNNSETMVACQNSVTKLFSWQLCSGNTLEPVRFCKFTQLWRKRKIVLCKFGIIFCSKLKCNLRWFFYLTIPRLGKCYQYWAMSMGEIHKNILIGNVCTIKTHRKVHSSSYAGKKYETIWGRMLGLKNILHSKGGLLYQSQLN